MTEPPSKTIFDSDEEDNKPEHKKLSKAQKKKLRQNKKKQENQNQQNKDLDQAQKMTAEVQASTKQQKKPNNQEQIVKNMGESQNTKKQKKGQNIAALLAKKKREEQEKFEAEQQRIRLQYQAEQKRLDQEEAAAKKRAFEEAERIRLENQAIKKDQLSKGVYIAKGQREKYQRMRNQLTNQKQKPDKQQTIQNDKQQKKAKRKQDVFVDFHKFFQKQTGQFRSPICCILGHVDTGKTTLLDKIRCTNVQEGEAGGITQQIGATFFPQQKLIQQIGKCQNPVKVEVPGLLIIDTPGHESFSNLRSRGSSLCDIAILVIDLHHGLENQTLESLQLLRKRNTPFIVALNKIDRSYQWNAENDSSSYLSLKKQNSNTLHDYKEKLQRVILQLNSKGENAAMYWENDSPSDCISLVPTSGITGEGIPDLLATLVRYSLEFQSIRKTIKVDVNKFNCTVMEVKMLQGYGTTIDCILVDGCIKKDDKIVLLGFEGPIVTKVKALLTPHPMKEMRIKDEYMHHKQMHAANGVKIAALGLDNAVAGTPLFVVTTEEQIANAKALCQNEFESVKKKIKLEQVGVGVAASTLGSLQALLLYLNKEKIPVSYVSVGPVSKDDVRKAMKAVLLDNPQKRKKQFCCLLVFDIKILADAQKFAEENEIKIFSANIIYHLTGMFNKYVQEVKNERRQKQGKDAVFPCILAQVATFRKSDPIVLGVDVLVGKIKIGTPLFVYRQGKDKTDQIIKVGVVESIEHNHKKLTEAKKITGSVAISIKGQNGVQPGKQFDQKDKLASLVSRRSIDCLKEHYKPQVLQEEWQLLIQLKEHLNIH